MNIMELGAIGELVGGLAVIGSLLCGGLQVRQNTRQLKSQARFQTLGGLMQPLEIRYGASVMSSETTVPASPPSPAKSIQMLSSSKVTRL